MRYPVALSVIIPCYRDEAALERLLHTLAAQSAQCAGEVQLLVVDGACSPSCERLCALYGARWVGADPCRGRQLALGAQHAAGEALWFLHADALLVGQPLASLLGALQQGALGGYFAFRFSPPRGWPARLLEPLINLRCRLGVPYGDQGLFARADAYRAAGGHAPWPLFEEVPLVKGLRRQGRFVRLTHGLEVDGRRWQQDGWWRRSLTNRLLALGFALGIAPQRLAGWYGRTGVIGGRLRP